MMTGGDRLMIGSKDVARAAISMSLTLDREEEKQLKQKFIEEKIAVAAVDFGGDFITSVPKIIERAVIASKREGVILETHAEEGAVAGAAHEAASQMISKAIGLNVGGKIGIARCGEHVAVALFCGIGLLHLNEVDISMGHRAISQRQERVEKE
ncbi:MAG: HutP family protein [Christensenellales bacterium]